MVAETVEAAREAGLRYFDDRHPGITRKKHGKQFQYFDPDGTQIADETELRRIKSLAVPPAYTNVWISPKANGHLQATGRDARGRKQYRYHKRFREVRDEAKYQRLVAFGKVLPAIRKAVDLDLGSPGLSQRKVLAAVVSLLDSTGIRVGNEEYAQANDSYGLTTLRSRHVRLEGSKVRLSFRGKTGKQHRVLLDDKRLARVIKRCRDLPGEELFEYLDDDGVQRVGSDDVNAYIREIAGDDFSAKDFRTWIGTVECIGALAEPAAHLAEAKANVTAALETVARRLGNTPAVCRKAYVHPAVLETYVERRRLPRNRTGKEKHPSGGLTPEERFALRFVERWESIASRR